MERPAGPPRTGSQGSDTTAVDYVAGDTTGALRLLAVQMRASETAARTGDAAVDAQSNEAQARRADAARDQQKATEATHKSGIFGKWSGALEAVAITAAAASAVVTGGATAVIVVAALAAKGAEEVAKHAGGSKALIEGLEIGSAAGLAVAGGVGAFTGAAAATSAAASGMSVVGNAAGAGSGVTGAIGKDYEADSVDDRTDATGSVHLADNAMKDGDTIFDRVKADHTHLQRVERTLRSTADQANEARLVLVQNVGKEVRS